MSLKPLALLALLGCGESPAEQIDAGPPTIELGSGETSFEPIPDGADLFIVQGPQDGYHFFGSVRATGVNAGDPQNLADPENPQTTFEVYRGSDRVDFMASSYRQGLRAGEGGVEMIGRTVILDIESDAELDGVELRFVVRIEDANGVRVEDERRIVGIPHPNNN